MADEKHETPAGRITAAITDLKPHAIPPVLAKDVLAVIASIPEHKQSKVSLALAKGCTGAIQGLPEHEAGEKLVHIQAGDLRTLLEAAGGNA
jgi:hypothetical protein